MKLPPASAPRADHATTLLRSRLIEGSIAPRALLAESVVARELGLSRVPVREALFTLERDGLVEFNQTGRAYVKELSAGDFEELFVLRQSLEPIAARLAAPALRVDASVLETNIAATRRARCLPEVTRLDLQFHEMILESSGNARLLRLWRGIRSEVELWLTCLHRRHRSQQLDTQVQTANSHAELLECFRTQSPAACERKMREHVLGWREWLPVLPENE